MNYWVLIILAMAVLVIFTLAATGVFGESEVEDDWQNPDLSDLTKVNLPIALFGYRRSTVDAIFEKLQSQTKAERSEKD